MKMKHTILTLIMAIMAFGANAQLRPVLMTGTASDTAAINTTPCTVTAEVIEDGYILVYATVTENSGTTAGKVELQGAGVSGNYIRIKGCAMNNAADTLKLTDVTTAQTIAWRVDPTSYRYYRVVVTGTGTMNARVKAYVWRRKKAGGN